MAVIRNRLNQRLIINLSGGKNIDLRAKGSVNVTEKELTSTHLQTLLNKGDIAIVQGSKSRKEGSAGQTKAPGKADASKKKDRKRPRVIRPKKK